MAALIDYFTIKALEDGLYVTFTSGTNDYPTYCIDYNASDSNWDYWQSMTVSSGVGTTVTINAGQTLSFRGKLDTGAVAQAEGGTYDPNQLGIGQFYINKKCNIYGNIMSLTKQDNFQNAGTTNFNIIRYYQFYKLFSGCTTIVDASELLLPITSFKQYDTYNIGIACYAYMFKGCTSLTKAPELPAFGLEELCYAYMFEGCTSLTKAPETLSVQEGFPSSCCESMFEGCTSLTKAPEIIMSISNYDDQNVAKTYSFRRMFYGCTSLKVPPIILPALTLSSEAYSGMFQNCTSLTYPPEIAATEVRNYKSCLSMFEGCTSLTKAPVLFAKNLGTKTYCYSRMFYGCTKLNYIKILATLNSSNVSSYNLENWVYGVSSNGTFVTNSGSWVGEDGVKGKPRNWTLTDDSSHYKLATKSYMNSYVRKGLWWDTFTQCVSTSVCNGIELVSFDSNLTPNSSITDSSGTPWYRIVKQQALSRSTSNTITMYYGIWNKKTGTQAKLDYVEVQISTSNDSSTGTWTGLKLYDGSNNIDPGNVGKNATTNGSMVFSIPSSYNLATTQYYIRVICGDTDNKQDWYYAWGNSSDTGLRNISSWSTASNVIKKYTNAIPLQRMSSTGDSILMDGKHYGGDFGRSSLKASCFKIE